MATEQNGQSGFRRALGVLWRVVLVLLLGIALGVGVYVGVPLAYRAVLEPSQVNAERIEQLERDLGQSQRDLERLRELSGERMVELETSQVEQGERLAELQAALDALRGDLADQASDLEAANDQIDLMVRTISNLETQLTELAENADDSELRQELVISRAMLYLLRARVWLLENNVGLAQDEALRARELLIEADPEGESDVIQAAILRLDLALDDLGSTPLVAADDLEIVWKLLVGAELPSVPESQETEQ